MSSHQMDEFLADIYGTRETIGADGFDQEKLAEVDFITNMCASEGVDVDDLTDEDAVKIAYEIWGTDSAIVKEAAEEAEEEDEEEEDEDEESMEEKSAQADHLGRIMAHSFVQERALIEKEAGFRDLAGRAGSKAVDILAGVGKTVAGKRGRGYIAGKAEKGARKDLSKELTKAMRSGKKENRQWAKATMKAEKGGGAETLSRALRKERKMRAGLGGAAIGGAGLTAAGAGYGTHKLLKKENSAINALAEQRALEMLKEAGYEEAFSDEEKVAMAIEQRAIEMLAEAGYPVG